VLAPHEGRAKVAIIDPADLMTVPAANALLKTLEEPRPGAFLILVSDRASSLLPTVRSRCQLVRFAPLPRETIIELLRERGIDPDNAEMAADLCGGSMELATTYLSEEIDQRIDDVFGILEGAIDRTPRKGLEVAAMTSGNRAQALSTLDLLFVVLSQIIWQKAHPGEAAHRVLARRMGARLLEVSRELSISDACGFVSAVNWAASGIRNNNLNPQLAIEGMLMSMRSRGGGIPAGSGFGVQ
jgi:DNA polymerase-3 subunit delta'